MRIARLGAADAAHARQLFAMMAAVFDEPVSALSDAYVNALLARRDFWAISAFDGDSIVGGVTAHTLPLTRTQSSEIFIYDVAVRADNQRQGIGRKMLCALRDWAAEEGISVLFVPADNEDAHALDFYRALDATESPVTFFTFSNEQN